MKKFGYVFAALAAIAIAAPPLPAPRPSWSSTAAIITTDGARAEFRGIGTAGIGLAS